MSKEAAGGAVGGAGAVAPPAAPLPGVLGSILSILGIGKKKAAGIIMEEDDFLKKWSGPMLVGPIVPAIMSTFLIVIGEIVLNSKKETCNYPIDIFIQAVIALCYMFLLIFSWSYLGDTITIKVPIIDADWTLFVPFTSLKFLMRVYFVLGFTAFIVFCVGATLLNLSKLCIGTAPRMYSLASFMSAMFWMGFIIVVILLVKLSYGNQIFNIIKDAAKAPSQGDMELAVFRKQFSAYDKEKNSTISNDDFGALLQSIGIYMPDKEQAPLIRTLDPENTGFIAFDTMYDWFKKMNAAGDEYDDGNAESSKKKA